MPRTPTKRRPVTRAALIDSAQALFTERGFHATSISDIVERAGLTRGAFYSNYRDKEELFLALYDAHTNSLLTALQEAAAEPATGPDTLERLLARIGERAREPQWFLASMEFTLHAARHPELAAALADHEERLVEGLATLLTVALARLDRRPAIPVADLSRLMISLFEGLAALRASHGTRDDAQQLPQRVAPRILQALTEPLEKPGEPQGS
ncbi:TetR/AcrR family transcriptional regulator (plasmid) [Streptomyces sp. NBC_01471]|uniref:TetR/AcrR family transcriptional regulator n=1 Tax=Streptomyces sp. NBC_01471 TaxID=2903879 RepID=UPI003243CF32